MPFNAEAFGKLWNASHPFEIAEACNEGAERGEMISRDIQRLAKRKELS